MDAQPMSPEEAANLLRTTLTHASLKAYPTAVVYVDDKASGIIVEVKPDGRVVDAKKADKVIWSAPLLTGQEPGAPVIRNITVAGGNVSVVVGKNRFVTLDLHSGKVLSGMAV